LVAVTPQVTPHVDIMDRIALIIGFCEKPRSRREIMEFLNLNDRKYFRDSILRPMIDIGRIKMTIPDKPKSPNQKYVVTKKNDEIGN